ncbi:MAG: 6-phosphofructokinase [Oligoflexales bacterium]
MRIGVCTGGGDCPGLNAAIRAVVKYGLQHGHQMIGVLDSYHGMMSDPLHVRTLDWTDVSEILHRGGTILGTHNSGTTFSDKDAIKRAVSGYTSLQLDALVVIGGEGTQEMARKLIEAGLNIVGVPKTIDNDLPGTERTIGFTSCVDLVADSIERLHSTAESHDRVMVLEVMGRDSGYIAAYGGIAGGANVVLIPEIPFHYEKVCEKIQRRKDLGRTYSVVVVAEGAKPVAGEALYKKHQGNERLGGIGEVLAHELYRQTSMETRVTVLGHLQRGGHPSAEDRLLATRLGCRALELVHEKKFGMIVGSQGDKVAEYYYKDIQPGARRVLKPDNDLLRFAEGIGISFGR